MKPEGTREIRIEEPFDADEYRNTLHLPRRIKMRRERKNIMYSVISAVAFCGLGVYEVDKESKVFEIEYMMFALAGYYVFGVIQYYINNFKLKNQTDAAIDFRIALLEGENSNSITTLNSEGLLFHSKIEDLRFDWELFSGYFEFEEYIVLEMDGGLNFIFGGSQLEQNKKDEILDFIRSRVTVRKGHVVNEPKEKNKDIIDD